MPIQNHYSRGAIDFLDLESKSRLHLATESPPSRAWFTANAGRILSAEASDKTREQIEVLLHFVLWAFKEGLYENGLIFAVKAVQFARQAHLPFLLRRALSLLAVMQSRIGNLERATTCYIEALQISEGIGDRAGKAATLANLAELRLNAGLVSESIDLNRYVIDLIEGEPQLFHERYVAHHNIACAALLLGDVGMAIKEIGESKRIARYPANGFFMHQFVIADTTECKILIAANKLSRARKAADRAAKRASQTSSRSALINASLASALCNAAEGKTNSALDGLDSVRTHIHKGEPLYRDFLEVEAICNRRAGRLSHADHLSKSHLANLAAFQRRFVIRQVAAIQNGIRVFSQMRSAGSAHPSRLGAIQTSITERVGSLANLSNQREGHDARYIQRVAELIRLFTRALGCSEEQSQRFGQAAKFHHIGILAIPDVLLLRRAALTPSEQEIVKRHTLEGCQILIDIVGTLEQFAPKEPSIDLLRTAAEMSLCHHESWDGSGYPRGISGPEIPISGRAIGIIDFFQDSTFSKTSHCIDETFDIMHSLAGKQFELKDVEIFESLVRELGLEHSDNVEEFEREENHLSVDDRACLVIDRIARSTDNPCARADP